MSITFAFTIGDRVYTESITDNCCPHIKKSPTYIITSFRSIDNKNFYSTNLNTTFEEDDLVAESEHAPYVYETLFNKGEIAYVKKKAYYGKLAAVFIAEIRASKAVGGIPVIIYKDNLNSLWDEEDLINGEAALALARARCS